MRGTHRATRHTRSEQLVFRCSPEPTLKSDYANECNRLLTPAGRHPGAGARWWSMVSEREGFKTSARGSPINLKRRSMVRALSSSSQTWTPASALTTSSSNFHQLIRGWLIRALLPKSETKYTARYHRSWAREEERDREREKKKKVSCRFILTRK